MTERWITETKKMVAEGYIHFYKKKGMPPPKVSKRFPMFGNLHHGLSDAGIYSRKRRGKNHSYDG